MTNFMTTPLGREVYVGDWKEYAIDQVLQLLYEFARNPLNDGTLVLSLASICDATRLDTDRAVEVARTLVERGWAEQPSPEKFQIVLRGIQVAKQLGGL